MTTPPHPRHAVLADDDEVDIAAKIPHPRHAAQPDDDKLDAAVLKTAGIVVVGVIMAILDMTIVNVAVPSFKDTFDTTFAVAAWTMTGYTLALATVIPLTGWAADRFGTKRLYIMALALFVAGSVLCSFATSIEMLIAFRVLQGLGGGMLMPLSMTIMTHAAGPHRVGRVMAVLGVPMLLGPISGPILGGWLLDHASWHWIFLINLPIGIVAILLAVFGLKPDRPEPSESFDFLGMLLLSPGLALFLFGVSSIPEFLSSHPGQDVVNAFTSPRVAISAIVGILLMAAFIPHANRTKHPLVDLTLFKNRDLTVSVLCFVFFTIAFFGAMLLLPSYLIQVRGEKPFDTGLLLAPQGLGAMLTMPLAGALTDKIGPRKIVVPGVALIAVSMAFFTQISADSTLWHIEVALFIMGLGMGCTMMPIMTAAIATLNHHQVARGSTLMNIVNQAGGSIGTAVMSTILTAKISAEAGLGMLSVQNKTDAVDFAAKQFGADPNAPGVMEQIEATFALGLDKASDAFGFTFLIAMILVVLTLIPALMLPSRGAEKKEGEMAPVLVH